MNTAIKLLPIILLFGCEKNTKQTTPQPSTCNCYEYHEALEPVGFPITTQWVYDYTSDTIPDLCSKETGNWVYNSNSTQRYKVFCN